jgi:hypothetical protein
MKKALFAFKLGHAQRQGRSVLGRARDRSIGLSGIASRREKPQRKECNSLMSISLVNPIKALWEEEDL